jgi:hypothetical protein
MQCERKRRFDAVASLRSLPRLLGKFVSGMAHASMSVLYSRVIHFARVSLGRWMFQRVVLGATSSAHANPPAALQFMPEVGDQDSAAPSHEPRRLTPLAAT